MGHAATTDRLLHDLEIERRLEGQVDSFLKRLLFLLGLKTVTPVASSTPGQSPPAVGARLLMSQENSIPLCLENPKIGGLDDAEVVADRIAEDGPVFRDLLT